MSGVQPSTSVGLPDAQAPVPVAGGDADESGSTVTHAVAARSAPVPGDGDVGHPEQGGLLGHRADRLIELGRIADAAVEGQADVQVAGGHAVVADGE